MFSDGVVALAEAGVITNQKKTIHRGKFVATFLGGQVDFVRGTSRSVGGKSIIALPSTAAKGTVSRICRQLDAGVAVSTSRNDVHYVVTEYGIADLRGKTLQQRAAALIAIAHPDFRDQLRSMRSAKEESELVAAR